MHSKNSYVTTVITCMYAHVSVHTGTHPPTPTHTHPHTHTHTHTHTQYTCMYYKSMYPHMHANNTLPLHIRSSFTMVTLALSGVPSLTSLHCPSIACGASNCRENISSGSKMMSLTIGILNDAVVVPGGKVTLKDRPM